MKIGFTLVDLKPLKEVYKFGAGSRGALTKDLRDELTAKIMMIENDDGSLWVHMSLPFGNIFDETHLAIYAQGKAVLGKSFKLTTSCTHTHYSADLIQNKEYGGYCIASLAKALGTIELEEKKLYSCYQYRYFDEVGRIRISGVNTKNLYLETYSIYDEEKRLATYIVYNSHPTTINLKVDYMSGAGPAILMKKLREAHPDEFFTYGMGAAGDISTRFTRTGQTYDDMLALTDKVIAAVEALRKNEVNLKKYPIERWAATEIQFPVKRGPRNMDEIDMSGELTPRELETIELAKTKHKNDDYTKLPTEIFLQKIVLGDHTFIYTPFELFSVYLECIDKDKATLVNLGNGRAGYLSGPGKQKMSFEVIGETIPSESKVELMKQLEAWGH